MVVITVEADHNARVHTITVKNKDFFWVKVKDVEDRLGIKNISDLLRKEICGRLYVKCRGYNHSFNRWINKKYLIK